VEVVLLILGIGYLLRGVGRHLRGGTGDLPALLVGAEAAGIITAAQRQRILAHAAEHPSGMRFGGAAWLGVFAGLFVVAGVCGVDQPISAPTPEDEGRPLPLHVEAVDEAHAEQPDRERVVVDHERRDVAHRYVPDTHRGE
jgi:hypothetical protein